MDTEWCGACGGQGYLDEEAAAGLGLRILDGRTMICPACDGSGEPPPRDAGCTVALGGGALIWAIIGAVLWWALHR